MPNPKFVLDDLMYGIGQTATNPQGGVMSKLANRTDLIARGAYTWIMDACLEFSRNYKFQWLEHTGPIVNTVANQYSYPLDNFLNSDDVGRIVNLIPTLFRYFLPYNPVPGTNSPGSELIWKSIDTLELMFNTPGVPAYFTRFGTQILISPVPNGTYPMFLRYQVEHPFSDPPAGSDPFLLDNDWREIAEYAAAERGAINLRMMDYATNYHQVLFGDPEFERSSGGRGNPGLIFRRFPQIETDSQVHMKSIRPMVPLI